MPKYLVRQLEVAVISYAVEAASSAEAAAQLFLGGEGLEAMGPPELLGPLMEQGMPREGREDFVCELEGLTDNCFSDTHIDSLEEVRLFGDYFATYPFVRAESGQFLHDAGGRRVLVCHPDDSICSLRYKADMIAEDPDFICTCGRLGRHMDELTDFREADVRRNGVCEP